MLIGSGAPIRSLCAPSSTESADDSYVVATDGTEKANHIGIVSRVSSTAAAYNHGLGAIGLIACSARSEPAAGQYAHRDSRLSVPSATLRRPRP
jgi:hypothetical protein